MQQRLVSLSTLAGLDALLLRSACTRHIASCISAGHADSYTACVAGPPSSALTQRAWRRPASPPSQSPPAAEVHALIGDLQHLTQAAFQDEVYSPRQQQLAADQSQAIKEHHVQQRASQLQVGAAAASQCSGPANHGSSNLGAALTVVRYTGCSRYS